MATSHETMIHNLIAHPLLAVHRPTGQRLHDYTARKMYTPQPGVSPDHRQRLSPMSDSEFTLFSHRCREELGFPEDVRLDDYLEFLDAFTGQIRGQVEQRVRTNLNWSYHNPVGSRPRGPDPDDYGDREEVQRLVDEAVPGELRSCAGKHKASSGAKRKTKTMATKKKTTKKTTKKKKTTTRTPGNRQRRGDLITTIVAFEDPEDIGHALITRYELVHAEPAGVGRDGRVWFVLTLRLKG